MSHQKAEVMTDFAYIRGLEEISFRAWPALETERYDGWVLRFANGYTGRANAANPLHGSTHDVEEKIAYCEAWFHARGLKPVFRLNDAMQPPDLDARLVAKGYVAYNESRVMVTDLAQANLDAIPQPAEAQFYLYQEANLAQWLDDLCRLNARHAPHVAMIQQLLAQLPTPPYYGAITVDGQVAAIGLGVRVDDHIGLFDIVTHEALRGRGYGRALVRGLLLCGQQDGAKVGFLQVAADNAPAVKLYDSLGFAEVYRYWYRTPG